VGSRHEWTNQRRQVPKLGGWVVAEANVYRNRWGCTVGGAVGAGKRHRPGEESTCGKKGLERVTGGFQLRVPANATGKSGGDEYRVLVESRCRSTKRGEATKDQTTSKNL